jgi:hypothetical protein
MSDMQPYNEEVTRSLLDQLLLDSQLYHKSKDFKELLDFVVKLRNFAPFNAMLLQVQKPGLRYAASARDWRERFGRTIKDGARPLLILWPFGPVALVYDEMDTEGQPLPTDVMAFFAQGSIDEDCLVRFAKLLDRKHIEWYEADMGDNMAGSIRVLRRPDKRKELRNEPKEFTIYCITINKNHNTAVRFATLVHELAHLFLGHLGEDSKLNIPDRCLLSHQQREFEAESVSYLVCARNGVHSKSETYLSNYVTQNSTIDDVDLYLVMKAAGQIEAMLGLTAHTKYDNPKSVGDTQHGLNCLQEEVVAKEAFSESSRPLAQRFMDYYNRIEQHLRTVLSALRDRDS